MRLTDEQARTLNIVQLVCETLGGEVAEDGATSEGEPLYVLRFEGERRLSFALDDSGGAFPPE